MDANKIPKTADDFVAEWRNHLGRKVSLIDETRAPLATKHREFVAFTAVLIDAGALLGYCDAVLKAREALPDVSESFKGRNLLHILSDDVFQPLVMIIGKTLLPPARLFIVATTTGNVKGSRAKVVIRSASNSGRPLEVRGPELKVVLHFIRQLGDKLQLGRADVILDRSQALGLDIRTRRLGDGCFEGFFGKLTDGGPDLAIISDSDDGVFRDALLLPDFAGYLLVHGTPDGMKKEKLIVASETPFFFREVLSTELIPSLDNAASRYRTPAK
jgi:hypothetical protein